jgi:hypothetical protein
VCKLLIRSRGFSHPLKRVYAVTTVKQFESTFYFSSINSAVGFFQSWFLCSEMFSLYLYYLFWVIPRRLNSLLLFVSRGLTVRTKHNCTVIIENSIYVSGDYIVPDNHGLLLHDLVHRPVSYKIADASFDFSDGNRSLRPCIEWRMCSGCCWLKLSINPGIEKRVVGSKMVL